MRSARPKGHAVPAAFAQAGGSGLLQPMPRAEVPEARAAVSEPMLSALQAVPGRREACRFGWSCQRAGCWCAGRVWM
ncbi:unnamed protein product [Effrenium voratum]|nr:unnamed protein product [Effrenium voratum]